MATAADHTIEEPLNAVLRLRTDLRIEQREFGGQPCYLIEDPLRAKFYRLGLPEYSFIAKLDGTRTVRAAIRDAATHLRELAFNECEALGICRWLLDTQLAETPHSAAHRRLTTKAEGRPTAWARLRHPLCVRVPLFNPAGVLDAVEPWLAWTLNKPFFLAWLACCLYALFVAVTSASALVAGTVVLLDRGHAWLLIAAWLVLKIVHETYHALVCRKYGGAVSEAGVFLLFFAPVPYVNVTASWRFASKWPRIATAAAGMYVELLLAAVAILVWANTGNGATRHVAASVAFMASLGTLLVNANPLLRFDGYFILADLLEIPNLNTHGRRWLGSVAARLLGCPVAPLGLPPRAARIVKVYAVAALLWRSMVWMTLMVALLVLLARIHPAAAVVGGLLIGAVAAHGALLSLGRWIKRSPAFSQRRLCAVSALGVIVFGVVAYALLGPTTISAPGIVEYRPLVVVRAATAGLIRELYVHDGDVVTSGQKLLVLENRELAVQLRMAQIDVEKSIARCRSLRQAGEIAKEQSELSQQAAFVNRRDELAEQLEDLVVVAPATGQIVGRQLDAWIGRYVETGTELFRIGDEAAKEVVVAIAQDDVELYQSRGAAPVSIRFSAPGVASLEAMAVMIEPRATTRTPHEALSSRLDGPLPVLVRDDPARPDSPSTDELLDPCFKASVLLSANQSRRLLAGQLATVEFRTSEQTWGRRILARLQRWFDHQLSDRI